LVKYCHDLLGNNFVFQSDADPSDDIMTVAFERILTTYNVLGRPITSRRTGTDVRAQCTRIDREEPGGFIDQLITVYDCIVGLFYSTFAIDNG